MNKAHFIEEITTKDPDTGGEVQVSLFKDEASGGIFGIDSSFIEQNFEEDEDVVINYPFQKSKVVLLTGV